MSMNATRSLPACFAPADAPAHAFICPLCGLLHRRVSAASNASCRPKIKQDPSMVATIDLHASRMAIGGVGGEEIVLTDDRLESLGRGTGSGRSRRL